MLDRDTATPPSLSLLVSAAVSSSSESPGSTAAAALPWARAGSTMRLICVKRVPPTGPVSTRDCVRCPGYLLVSVATLTSVLCMLVSVLMDNVSTLKKATGVSVCQARLIERYKITKCSYKLLMLGYEMTGSGECRDVDECRRGVCQGGHCVNTDGDFTCHCPPGLHLSSDKKHCIDHDECSLSGMCSNGECINKHGTFECQCLPGFKLSTSGMSCVDHDECLENPRICLKGACKNTPGSYVCICEDGYVHSADGGFCRDLNECNQSGVCDNGQCINVDGSFKCICDPGYELELSGKHCQDINECSSNPCLGGQCTNTDGGYECQCPPGLSLGQDGRTCSDGGVLSLCYAMVKESQCINPSTKPVSKSTCCCCSVSFSHRMGWGSPCSACPAPGSSEYDQLCPHGSGFTHSGDDINECSTQTNNICEHGACENLAGSYRCQANPGYQVDMTGKHCLDVDECALDPLLCSGGQCRNTQGSFKCICPTGTTLNTQTYQVSGEDHTNIR